MLFHNYIKSNNLHRPLILDGATGTKLIEHNHNFNDSLWTSIFNITNPELVIKLHREYLEAGADIITTNTFRTNYLAYKNSSIEISHSSLVKRSVNLAIEARNGRKILIAGSNAPAEDCYQTNRTISHIDLIKNHHLHIDELMSAGVDFILNETQSHFDEIKIIAEYCYQNKIPFVLSLYFDDELRILSGETVSEIIEYLKPFKPLALGFNCVSPKRLHSLLTEIELKSDWGFYLNCGDDNSLNNKLKCTVTPDSYIDKVSHFPQSNYIFIGACCGSSPSHIKEIKRYLDGKNIN
ncbi:MAG: homocysteine S-methyltransferase family protein [Ignavibacteria bacterium]|nr:homocysteine S-methyltransferase family protein [Ignavibacteria bacterium]